mmetsp:Transcript_6219/g.9616  ORF Transcript_6219/g.9616 Transcript_6219/m.9616 type:complete len:206 (-) Transcript_6219:869-1486(-)
MRARTSAATDCTDELEPVTTNCLAFKSIIIDVTPVLSVTASVHELYSLMTALKAMASKGTARVTPAFKEARYDLMSRFAAATFRSLPKTSMRFMVLSHLIYKDSGTPSSSSPSLSVSARYGSVYFDSTDFKKAFPDGENSIDTALVLPPPCPSFSNTSPFRQASSSFFAVRTCFSESSPSILMMAPFPAVNFTETVAWGATLLRC